jgi:hypothetical protein
MKQMALILILLSACTSAEREQAFASCLDSYFAEKHNPIILTHKELIRLCQGRDPELWLDTRISLEN